MNPLEMRERSRARMQNQVQTVRGKYLWVRYIIILVCCVVGFFIAGILGTCAGFVIGTILG